MRLSDNKVHMPATDHITATSTEQIVHVRHSRADDTDRHLWCDVENMPWLIAQLSDMLNDKGCPDVQYRHGADHCHMSQRTSGPSQVLFIHN